MYGDRGRGGRGGYRDRGPPNRGDFRGGRGGPSQEYFRGPPPNRGDFRGGRGPPRDMGTRTGIYFNSYEEERAWVEERREKRLRRKSKFDVPPTPEQMAMDAKAASLSNFAATDFSGVVLPSPGGAAGPGGSPAAPSAPALISGLQPQQTRHARRLYVGNLPPSVNEDDVHKFFREAIQSSMPSNEPPMTEDPILSVYINHERRFSFLEFKSVEMTTACLSLDGIDILGKGKVKIKRPNDYNPHMAPKGAAVPRLDVSKLGIISTTVQDGPNKIFIGGLHYYLQEDQILEILKQFGSVRAFHLVKDDADAVLSKGYAFVEYSDPAKTQVAIMGLNGMDLGGGKTITARLASTRDTMVQGVQAAQAAAVAQAPMVAATTGGAAAVVTNGDPTSGRNIVNGYDIEQLVDAAMGLCPMPAPPDPVTGVSGVQLTSVAATMPVAMTAVGTPVVPAIQQPAMVAAPAIAAVQQQAAYPIAASAVGASALDIANAALEQAFGGTSATAQPQQPQASVVPAALPPPPQAHQPQPPAGAPPLAMLPNQQQAAPSQVAVPPQESLKTRILVLLNMVMDEDLSTDEDYNALVDEVREECSKFGKLLSMQIPRPGSPGVEPSAIKKIFIEYATVEDAAKAESELAGRTFGPNVVAASYFNEAEYSAGRLK